MSRWARRVDTTQPDMVRDLLRAGVSVLNLSRLGKDVPDLLACLPASGCVLVEAKSPKKIAKKKGDGLSPGQIEFAKNWHGCPVIRAETAEDVLQALAGHKTAASQIVSAAKRLEGMG